MKKLLPTVLLLFCCFTIALIAEAGNKKGKLSQEERDYLVGFIRQTEEQLMHVLEATDEELFNYSPGPGKWTIKEHFEHLLITEEAGFQNIRENLLATPRNEDLDLHSNDPFILIQVTDLTKKAKTLPVFEPSGTWETMTEMLNVLKDSRNKMVSYISSTSDELRYYSGQTPLGEADAYQHFLLITAHGLRHTMHIRNIIEAYEVKSNYQIRESQREFALEYFSRDHENLLQEIATLSESQWNFRPEEGSWTIAEISEHILLAEEQVMGSLDLRMNGNPTPEKEASVRGKTEKLIELIMNRDRKFQARSNTIPHNRFSEPADFIRVFEYTRGKTMDYIKSTDDPLLGYHMTFGPLGDVSIYDWVVFIAAHAERHIEQIKEVKSHPGFAELKARN